MNAIRARQKPIGPIATSMNGRRRPIGVWNVSLQGPITSGSVRAKIPSAASTAPISEVDSVYCAEHRRQVGGRRRQRPREAERADAQLDDGRDARAELSDRRRRGR